MHRTRRDPFDASASAIFSLTFAPVLPSLHGRLWVAGSWVPVGEMVRLRLTNTANTRVFNMAFPGARMKLIGGDSGRYEHDELVDQVLLAPRSGRWSTSWSSGPGSSAWSTTPLTALTDSPR
jgi:hypothetical protein